MADRDRSDIVTDYEAMAKRYAGHANDAYEAIRTLNHITQGQKIPAPVIYTMLDDLAGTCAGLQQLLDQLTYGLKRSVDEDNLTDDKGAPRDTLVKASVQFSEAGWAAARAGRALRDAHVTINSQRVEATKEWGVGIVSENADTPGRATVRTMQSPGVADAAIAKGIGAVKVWRFEGESDWRDTDGQFWPPEEAHSD